MIEIAGIVFGGLARLGQYYLESKDKDKERQHEAAMFDKQVALQSQKAAAETDLRKMEIAAEQDKSDLSTLTEALKSQSDEAKSAGGWTAKLSASVRPVLSYWVYLLYTISKIGTLILAFRSGRPVNELVGTVYTEFDGALLGSLSSFWFADRSLRKAGRGT